MVDHGIPWSSDHHFHLGGLDAIKSVVLKELSHTIAPTVAAIFQESSDEGTVDNSSIRLKKARVCLLYKKATNQNQLITVQSLYQVCSARRWNTSLLPVLLNVLTGTVSYMISSTDFVKGDHVKSN